MNDTLFLLLTLLFCLTLNAQKMLTPTGAYCDPATGLCTPSNIDAEPQSYDFQDELEIIYVGDPMCSWCWGISPELNRLERAARVNGIPYRIVVGGLRPGGGDAWTDEFKSFLRHHWEEVNQRSGQPFGQALFQLDDFNYDTEPACRAVVAIRQMAPDKTLRFFELTQHHFYVKNKDPKTVEFYAPICNALQIDFATFKARFNSEELRQATQAEFQLSRQWGVTGYPTVILRKGKQLYAIARGYADFERMWSAVQQLVE